MRPLAFVAVGRLIHWLLLLLKSFFLGPQVEGSGEGERGGGDVGDQGAGV